MRNTPFRAKNKKRAFDFQLVMKFVITLVITKIKPLFAQKRLIFENRTIDFQ